MSRSEPTQVEDLIRASLMCGLEPGGQQGAHRYQIFYFVWKTLGRRSPIDALQRALENGVEDHFWSRTSKNGVYYLTQQGLREGKRRCSSIDKQPMIRCPLPPERVVLVMDGIGGLGERVRIRNTGGHFEGYWDGRPVTGPELLSRWRDAGGEEIGGKTHQGKKYMFNYGLKNDWRLLWNPDEGDGGDDEEDGYVDMRTKGGSPEGRSVVTRDVWDRPGQRKFRRQLIEAYAGRCCITGETLRCLLQAAHIHPVADGGGDDVCNGLLLRADVHILFDRDLLWVDPDHSLVRLHPALGNTEYGELQGRRLLLPENEALRPDLGLLRQRYRGRRWPLW